MHILRKRRLFESGGGKIQRPLKSGLGKLVLALALLLGGSLWVGIGVRAGAQSGAFRWESLVASFSSPQSPKQSDRPAGLPRPVRREKGPQEPLSQVQSPAKSENINRTSATATVIAFENTPAALVTLGSQASRTQCRPLTKTGSAVPYLMTGTGSGQTHYSSLKTLTL